MMSEELREALNDLDLSQVELALLLGVTSRAVALWLSDERSVPGPVGAYLRLLKSLPKSLQVQERARLKYKETDMFDGMYQLQLKGNAGATVVMLVIRKNQVFGSDGAVNLDGTCEPSATKPGEAVLHLKITVPPNVALIMGKPPVAHERRFDVEVAIKSQSETKVRMSTPDGDVRGTIALVREIPLELAA
jgi:transcriptional regulator with XRE-family HTH domain